MAIVDQLALAPLRKAVDLSPNNVKSYQLLADVLLAQAQVEEARDVLERLYKFQPTAARSRLIHALLILAEEAIDNENEQLKLYERVLELEANHPEAKKAYRKIWVWRGDEAQMAGDLEAALLAYQKAHFDKKVAAVDLQLRFREIEARLKIIRQTKQAGRYEEALKQLQQLAEEYPNQRDWAKLERQIPRHEFEALFRLMTQAEQAGHYKEALEKAQQLLDEYSDKQDWAEELEKIKEKMKFLEQKIQYRQIEERLKMLESSEKRDLTHELLQHKSQLVDLYQRVLSALKHNDREAAKNLLAQVVVLEKMYGESPQHFAGTEVINAMHQYAEKLAAYQHQENELKQRIAEERNVLVNTQESYLQHENQLKQFLVQEKNARAHVEQELILFREQENDLKQRLFQEQKARTQVEQALAESCQQENLLKQRLEQKRQELGSFSQQENELKQHLVEERQALAESRQQENALKQRLDQEKEARTQAEQALTESRQQENLLKQRLEQERQELSSFSQQENELKQHLVEERQALAESRQQENALKQRLDQEKEARTQAEQALTESRQQENELKQRLAQEQQVLIELRQQENALKQRLDQETNARNKAAQDKEKMSHQHQQEITLLNNELLAKEKALHQAEEEAKNSLQCEKDLTLQLEEKNTLIIQQREKQKSRRFLGLGAFIIAIMLLILVIYLSKNNEPQLSPKEPIVLNEQAKASTVTTEVTTPIPSRNMCVYFKERSWIRIIDQNGKKLYEGFRNAGEILPLEGTPPFYMRVGKINEVYVEKHCEISQVSSYPKQEGYRNKFIVGNEE